MTVFVSARCPVQSCILNLGERGVVCGWLTGKSKRCHHSQWYELWAQLTEAQEAQVPPLQAHSLAGR